MDKNIIDKCLDFAEGNKGKFTILMAKKPGFPDTLIDGTEKQRLIKGYVKQGIPTRQIADMLGCTQPNIVEHMRQYKKSVAFYGEWCEFWEFAADVRQTPVAIAFAGVLTGEEIADYIRRGIVTVGDFLTLSVTVSVEKLLKINGLDASKKAALFDCIRNLCYGTLGAEDLN